MLTRRVLAEPVYFQLHSERFNWDHSLLVGLDWVLFELVKLAWKELVNGTLTLVIWWEFSGLACDSRVGKLYIGAFPPVL